MAAALISTFTAPMAHDPVVPSNVHQPWLAPDQPMGDANAHLVWFLSFVSSMVDELK